jgi:PAS domain-containing protein
VTVNIDDGTMAEEWPRLVAQLQATLNVIPAYTWYAALSGGLIFVNKRTADYLGLPKDHRVSASTLAHSGTPITRCCIRTTTKKHAKSGQPVCARARPVRRVFEFVTRKVASAGSSVAPNRSGGAMELYCTGSG